jgi:hypothetical protein
MLTVSFSEFVDNVVATSFVDARRELPQRLVAKSGCVQQRCHQCTGTFGPVIVTSIASTTSRDVDETARSENCAIPRKTLSNR